MYSLIHHYKELDQFKNKEKSIHGTTSQRKDKFLKIADDKSQAKVTFKPGGDLNQKALFNELDDKI